MRENGARLLQIRLRPLDVDFGDLERGACLCRLGLLLAKAEPGEDLPLADMVAVIRMEFHERSSSLEADFGHHAGLDRAQSEYTDRNITLGHECFNFDRTIAVDDAGTQKHTDDRDARKGTPDGSAAEDACLLRLRRVQTADDTRLVGWRIHVVQAP
ncbi:hypothetical protein BOSEA31B_14930 [Hyphomicrobiales bacterium]|nr:hypothetical protein BOSEA31B_14930 [Hyphomicrobiales bacterium]CAH1701417.1 hypothetical protein BOSEA1005_21117 [Hyphomicrobiales bacterium]CAI0345374.1 hypothetical protein BO1005MUT1_390046 [Hyphomicrobiales bacterium]